jgi:prepilin-type N-terminal cleavage/methylation domain-containing protein/prepilin-type processing-associated H-X9-DG protein
MNGMFMKTKKGFTLIELLVVIAIIALLLAILMPALGKAKDHAKKITCATNLKSLSLGVIMYADDYDGWMPSSTNTWSGGVGWTGRTLGLPIQDQIANLEKSQLWPYMETTKAWRCPTEPDKDLLTTYAMSGQCWGAYKQPDNSVHYDTGTTGLVCNRLTDMRSPSARFLFLDQLGLNHDSYFALWYSKPQWWNIPNFKHSGGSVNGFADGHVEPYKLTKETARIAKEAYETAGNSGYYMPHEDMPDNDDLKYYQRATWGGLGW